jgi:predicted PurR-regulated permease PerM
MVHPQVPQGSILAMVTLPDRPRPAELFRWGVFLSLGVVVTLLVLRGLYSIRGILVQVLVALFITVSLEPAVQWLTGRGIRRGLAVTLIFAVAFAALLGFLISVIPPLVNEGRQLIDDLPGYLAELQARSAQFRELNDRFNLSSQLQGMVGSVPGRIGSGVLGFTGRLFGALFSALTVLVFTAYFMADLPRIRNGLVWLFPAPGRPRAKQVVDLLVDKVGGYMIGNIIISIIAGVSSFLAFKLLGVSFAVPLAVLVAVFDLIPMIGATLGAVVGVTVAAFTTPLLPNTILVAAFFVAYQQVENYLIAPRVLKTTVDIGAAAVLLAGLIGATLLGLVGALMAIPVAAALNVLLNERLAAREAAAAGPDTVAAAGEVAAPSETREAVGHPAAPPPRPDLASENPRPDLAGGGEIKG